MKRNNRQKKINTLILWMMESLYFVVPSLLLAWIIDAWFIFRLTTLKMMGVYIALMFVFGWIYKAYSLTKSDYSKLIYGQIITIFLSNILISFVLWVNDRNYLNLVEFLLLLVGSSIFNVGYTKLLLVYRRHYIGPTELIVVVDNNQKDRLLHQLNRVNGIYTVNTVYDATSTHLVKTIHDNRQEESILLCSTNQQLKHDLLNYGFFNKIEIIIIPSIEDILIENSRDAQFIDSPFFIMDLVGPRWYERLIKRIVDIVVSVIALVVLSPVFLIVAIAIKLDDHGPVFYAQTRLTYKGKLFKVYKFRSMRIDAEANGAQLAKENDDRITKVGKILRKFRLDELPQVINILNGDMTLVGPRPERPEIAKEYEKTLPQFKYRLNVKAGLTGYAQIYGRYNTSPEDKLKLDLMYIGKYSLLLDLELIFKTVQILFEKESTEGF